MKQNSNLNHIEQLLILYFFPSDEFNLFWLYKNGNGRQNRSLDENHTSDGKTELQRCPGDTRYVGGRRGL